MEMDTAAVGKICQIADIGAAANFVCHVFYYDI